MSEQVVGTVMTTFGILLAIAFVGFFMEGIVPSGTGNFWVHQATQLGWDDPGACGTAFSFGRTAVYMFLNVGRESVM